MSQRGLASASGVPQPSIARWLSGRRDITTGTLERIMAALDLTIQPAKPTKPAISGVWVNPPSEAMLNMMIPPKQGTDKMARVMSEMPEWPWSQEYGAKPSPDATTPKRV